MKKIPYGRQSINEEDINEVVKVLQSDFLTQGPKVKEFEIAFASYVGSKFAVAVSNGTAALHLSAMVLGTKKGDKIITTPITFAASANCIKYCDAEIDFVDIEENTLLLDIDKLEQMLKRSPIGTYAGIVSVDFSGLPVNLERLKKIAKDYNLWIIQDACHSPGGYFIDSNNELNKCGNNNYANISIFSFHPVKHIACGEGGMITTNDEKVYKRLLNLRSHGIQQDHALNKFNHGVWYYEMQELGYNYRLTDFQAALGISQVKRANINIEKRKQIAKKYFDAFENKKFIIKQSGIIDGHAYHLYIIEVENRNGLINYLREKNIFCQVHYIPLHLMPYYRDLGWKEGDFPIAENYYQRGLSIPIFPLLTSDEQDYIIKSIYQYYNE